MSLQNCRIESVSTAPEEYFKTTTERGILAFPMSSSSIREFSRCPSRWRNGYEPPDSDAKDYGSLLDCLVLTPDQFKLRYAVKPATYPATKTGEQVPWNMNSTFCKEWCAAQGGAEVISQKIFTEAQLATKRLFDDEIIKAFINESEKQVWVSGEWHDEKSGLTIPVKCLIDLAPRKDSQFPKCLGDLKTTRNAALQPWARWCFSAGYHVQAAFNQALYVAATGEDRNTFCFVLQENYPPFQTGKRLLAQDFMELGTAEYVRGLDNYCACLKSGRWPSYDDNDESVQSWSVVAPEPWMSMREQFAAKLDFDATEVEDDLHPDIIP